MKKLGRDKIQSAIGLDIGSYSIKCVELTRSDGQIRLDRVSILPADRSTPAAFSKALRLTLDPWIGQGKRVRISVSGGASLIIRRVTLPAMTPAELKGAIRFEAESHIPFPIDDCQLDFQILNHSEDKKQMNVLLVAAKKDFIAERLKWLADAGMPLEIIDLDIFCLVNAFEALGDVPPDASFGLLNVGHKVSSFAIIQNKLPFFVREIPFGAFGVTQALMQKKSVPEAEADRLKVEKPADAAADLEEATARGFEPLVDEIRHSIDYYENEQEELRTIYLSGGGSLSMGAAKILSDELGKEVLVWNNTKKMEVFGEIDQKYLAEHAQELNVAFGMVLRAAEKRR